MPCSSCEIHGARLSFAPMTAREFSPHNLSKSSAATLAGIGFMLLASLMFSANDAMGKWLVATYSVGQLLLIRSIAALIVLAPLIYRQGWTPFKTARRPGLQILRIVLATVEVALFYWAVVYLPLADAVTFYLAGPIFVTALSAMLLHEAVGWRRWSAVLVGFVGVVIALRPTGASLAWPALIALAGCIVFSFYMIVTRMLRGTSDIVLISGQTIGALVFGAIFAPLNWVTPSLRDTLLLGLLGIVAMIAHAAVNRSLMLAPASIVVPFQYTLIVWAIVFGVVFFGDIPDPALLGGGAIIIAAGLFIFVREHKRGASPQNEQPPY